MIKRKVSKDCFTKILNVECRTTIYNYINEINNFISDFGNDLDHIIEIYYELNSKSYVLSLKTKK